MRLLGQSTGRWEYELSRNEADVLFRLVKKFPFTETGLSHMSRTDDEPTMAEREKLLNESLAEHRKELTKLALNFLAEDKWRRLDNGQLLALDSTAREILLQILNDIRVGCWRALGQPENLDTVPAQTSAKDQTFRNLMDVAGYFEMNLLEPEG
jgi:hypothetical protein